MSGGTALHYLNLGIRWKCVVTFMPRPVKVKLKFNPEQAHEGPDGEYRYSSTLSLTSALDGVGGQGHGPVALPPGK